MEAWFAEANGMNAALSRAKRTQAGGSGTLGECGTTLVTLVLKGLGALPPRQQRETPNCFLLLQRRERK